MICIHIDIPSDNMGDSAVGRVEVDSGLVLIHSSIVLPCIVLYYMS